MLHPCYRVFFVSLLDTTPLSLLETRQYIAGYVTLFHLLIVGVSMIPFSRRCCERYSSREEAFRLDLDLNRPAFR